MFGKKNEVKSGSAPTYIGSAMRIEGDVWGSRPIWVDGEVRGMITCDTEVVVGATAKVYATIRAAIVRINGYLEGEVFASERMEVMSQGHIQGDITSRPGCLIVQEGGVVEGQCITTQQIEIPKRVTDAPTELPPPKGLPETQTSSTETESA